MSDALTLKFINEAGLNRSIQPRFFFSAIVLCGFSYCNMRSFAILNQMNVVFFTLFTHIVRPNAGLYFPDVCLA